MTSKITTYRITPKDGDWKNGTNTEIQETVVDDAWFARSEANMLSHGSMLIRSHGFTIRDLEDGLVKTTKGWDLADLERLFALWAPIKAQLIERYPDREN